MLDIDVKVFCVELCGNWEKNYLINLRTSGLNWIYLTKPTNPILVANI